MLAHGDIVIELTRGDSDPLGALVDTDGGMDRRVVPVEYHRAVEPDLSLEPDVLGLVIRGRVDVDDLIVGVPEGTQVLVPVEQHLDPVLARCQFGLVVTLRVGGDIDRLGIGVRRWIDGNEGDVEEREPVARQVTVIIPVVAGDTGVGDVVRLEREVLLGRHHVPTCVDIAGVRLVGIDVDGYGVVQGSGYHLIAAVRDRRGIEAMSIGLEYDVRVRDPLVGTRGVVPVVVEEDVPQESGPVRQFDLAQVHVLRDIDMGEVDTGPLPDHLGGHQGVLSHGQVDPEDGR